MITRVTVQLSLSHATKHLMTPQTSRHRTVPLLLKQAYFSDAPRYVTKITLASTTITHIERALTVTCSGRCSVCRRTFSCKSAAEIQANLVDFRLKCYQSKNSDNMWHYTTTRPTRKAYKEPNTEQLLQQQLFTVQLQRLFYGVLRRAMMHCRLMNRTRDRYSEHARTQ